MAVLELFQLAQKTANVVWLISQDKTVAIIPCLDEARGIAALVQEVRRYVSQVMVVDDGSRDATASAALAAGARVLRHKTNRGKGAAINTGLAAAFDSGFRHAVILDGDGQHQPKSISELLRRAAATGAPLVIGDRMRDVHAMPLVRRLVNRWMSRQISQLAGRAMPDTQCGFRVIGLQAWRELTFEAEHFEVESEMTLGFARRGHRIEFVPVKTVRGNRPSHIRPLRDAWRWLKWWRTAARGSACVHSGAAAGENPLPICR